MNDLLSKRLKGFSQLIDSDVEQLRRACVTRPRIVRARQSLVTQGETLRSIPFILQGWVSAAKHLEDGRWQMLSLFLAGDFCDHGLPASYVMDHSLRAVTDTIVFDLAQDKLDELSFSNPRLGKALRWTSMVQASISREWVVSLGQRKAKERCAHLICELFWRLRAVDCVKGESFEFPLTQEQVGAAIGISTVHANRMLQELRGSNLIEQDGRRMRVLNRRGLENLAMFDSRFLQIGKSAQAMMDFPHVHPSAGHPIQPRQQMHGLQ